MGEVIAVLETDDFDKAKGFYARSDTEQVSVRASVDGKLLTYPESDRLFGRLSWFGRVKRKKVI